MENENKEILEIKTEESSEADIATDTVTVKKRIGKAFYIYIAMSLILAGTIGYTGYYVYQVNTKYSHTFSEAISQDELDEVIELAEKEKELIEIEREINARDRELQSIIQQLGNLEDKQIETAQRYREINRIVNPSEQDKLEDILDLFERNMIIVDDAKILVLENLGFRVQAAFKQRSDTVKWRDDVIGSMFDNSMIAGGITGAFDSFEGGGSVGDVFGGIASGVIGGAPSFIQGEVMEALVPGIGGAIRGVGTIFNLVDLVKSLFSKDPPPALVNSMGSEQQIYADKLTAFIAAESVTYKDISNAAGYFYQMKSIANQLNAEADQISADIEAKSVYRKLKNMAAEYQANNKKIMLHLGYDESDLIDTEEVEDDSLINDLVYHLTEDEIEEEILRINRIGSGVSENWDNGYYTEVDLGNGNKAYFDDEVKIIHIFPDGRNSTYTREYYIEDGKLYFVHYYYHDSHRLYFKNDSLFRWRYSENVNDLNISINYDYDESQEYKAWESFALEEFYLYINQLN